MDTETLEQVTEANNQAAKSVINAPVLPSTLTEGSQVPANEATEASMASKLHHPESSIDGNLNAHWANKMVIPLSGPQESGVYQVSYGDKPPITLNEIAAGNG